VTLVRTRAVALVAGLGVLAGCYTQLRTGPREPPPREAWAPPPAPATEPPPAVTPVEPAIQPIDGDYSGYSIVIDAFGHHTGRVRCSFHDGIYRCEGDDLQSTGAYTLGPEDVVFQMDDSLKAAADSALALEGTFELHRNDAGIQLVHRDELHGLYIELGLQREEEPTTAEDQEKI
jgi:hypothetical protein